MAGLNKRYAAALFELTKKQGNIKEHTQQAQFMQKTLQNKQLSAFLLHPHINDKQKKELVTSLFGGKVSSHLIGFLYLAIAKNRETIILPALSEYIKMLNIRSNKTFAKVTSAVDLNKKQQSRLHKLLSEKTQKQVDIEFYTNPEIMGGFHIYMDGTVIDRSVRTKLTELKKSIERGAN